MTGNKSLEYILIDPCFSRSIYPGSKRHMFCREWWHQGTKTQISATYEAVSLGLAAATPPLLPFQSGDMVQKIKMGYESEAIRKTRTVVGWERVLE
jgi:hypothetical protein